jgi:hypothetical protein
MAAILLVSLRADTAFTASVCNGAGSVRGMKAGSCIALPYDGDNAGVASMDASFTTTGFGQLGPGTEGLTLPAYRAGVCHLWLRYDGYRVMGTPFESWPNNVRRLRVDSLGVNITGVTEFHNITTRFYGVVNPTGTDMVLYAIDSIGTAPMPVSFGVNRGVQMKFPGDSLIVSGPARANGGLMVAGQKVNKILRGSATLDFDLSAVNCQDLTITMTGAAVGDEVFLGAPNGSIVADETFSAWVSSTNTVTVRACDGAGAGNPASGTYKVTVFQ